MDDQLNVLIAWSSPALAQSLCDEIELQNEVPVTCTAERPADVPANLVRNRVDVLLIEDQSSHAETLELLAFVRLLSPRTRCLLLVDAHDDQWAAEVLRHGASGCLLKSTERSFWSAAVRILRAESQWHSPPRKAAGDHFSVLGAPQVLASSQVLASRGLTHREQEVLSMIGTGLTNKEIARQLRISDNTVKTHLHRAYVKLQQSGRYKAYLAHPSADGATPPVKQENRDR